MKNVIIFWTSMVFENMFVRFVKEEQTLLELENKSIIY